MRLMYMSLPVRGIILSTIALLIIGSTYFSWVAIFDSFESLWVKFPLSLLAYSLIVWIYCSIANTCRLFDYPLEK